MCRDRVDQFCELSASYGAKPGQSPLPPWGTLDRTTACQWSPGPGSDFSKSGTGTGESPQFRTNRGRGRGSVPAPGQIGDGDSDAGGDGDRGVRALVGGPFRVNLNKFKLKKDFEQTKLKGARELAERTAPSWAANRRVVDHVHNGGC